MRCWFRKKGRRLLSLLLTAVVVLGLLPGVILAPAVAAAPKYKRLKITAAESDPKNQHIHFKPLAFGATEAKTQATGGTSVQRKGPSSGSYEISFRTPKGSLPGSIGFLIQFKDETYFQGITFDVSGNSSKGWYTYDSTFNRWSNELFSVKNPLEPDRSYTIKLEHEDGGDGTVAAWLQDDDAEGGKYQQIGTWSTQNGKATAAGNFITDKGGFAVHINQSYSKNSRYIILKRVAHTGKNETLTVDYGK